jgi:nucleoside-diphosphate-sugar epimerase
VAQYIESTDRLNTSSQVLYAVLSGQQKEIIPQAIMLWVNAADVGTAHVLAIDSPNAGNHRFLVCADSPYTNKAISDVFIKNFPDAASVVPTKLPEGVDEDGFPVEGYYTGDNSSSKKLLGMKYQNFEDTMIQFANSVKNLPKSS